MLDMVFHLLIAILIISNFRVFIGAPKSNTSSGNAYSNDDVEPGVMWRCSLGAGEEDKCEMMNIDPLVEKNKNKGNRPTKGNPAFESHDGSWIGVSSEIKHDRFVTCGMRWNRGQSNYYNGICYWFADNNTSTSYLWRNLNDLVNEEKKKFYDQRLIPFFTKFTKDEDNEAQFNFTNSQNKTENGLEWQVSQAGLSVHLFKDSELGNQPNLLIGAPGVRQWAGAVVLYANTNINGSSRMNKDPKDSTFSEFVVLNRGVIPSRKGHKSSLESVTHWDEYFGYSVTSGRYLSSTKVLYASGAPRAENDCGAVIVFDSPTSSHYKRQIHQVINITAPESPACFTSYFGSVIHSVDLDGNGLDELIVGAPMYTFSARGQTTADALIDNIQLHSKKHDPLLKMEAKVRTSTDSLELGDHGCVFVYRFRNAEGDSGVNTSYHQALAGSITPQARFGSAISSLKVNNDVYLVIGAPFESLSEESGDSRTGAVYFYLYDNDKGRFGSYSQRITASRIHAAVNGFGSSLSIPADIDRNETPDLAIGAFKSGHVVILRMRPKIQLNSTITIYANDDTKEVTKIIRGSKKFHVRSCYSIKPTFGVIVQKHGVGIWTKVVLRDDTVVFEKNGQTEITDYKKVEIYNSQNCVSFSVVAVGRDGIGMDDDQVDNPLRFYQVVWYNDTLTDSVSAYNIYANEPKQPQNFKFGSFNPNWPSAQRTTAFAEALVTDCLEVCYPNLAIQWSFYYPESKGEEDLNSYLLGSSSEIVMKLLIINNGETAEGSKIEFLWDWKNVSITESTSRQERWLQSHCENASDDTHQNFKNCRLRVKIRPGQSETIRIYLNTEEIAIEEPKDFKFTVEAEVSFNDKRVLPFTTRGTLPMKFQPTRAVISGNNMLDEFLRGVGNYYAQEVRTPSLYTKESIDIVPSRRIVNLYTPIRQKFVVTVKGTSVSKAIAKFQIPIFWRDPENRANSKSLFLISYHDNSNKVNCKATSQAQSLSTVQPITFDSQTSSAGKHVHLDEKLRRRRRAAEDIVNQTQDMDTSTVNGEVSQDNLPTTAPPKQAVPSPKDDALVINCVSESDCLVVECEINKAKANVPIYIQFDTYPIKTEIDNLLTNTKKSSLYIESKGFVEIFQKSSDRRHYQDSDVAITVLAQISPRVATLMYIAAIVGASIGGILLLALIIFGLYKCGFFKREKRQELNQMKAEHNRKSMMIAAARASMMMQTTSGIDSRENLTESEFRNEDTVMSSAKTKHDEPIELKD